MRVRALNFCILIIIFNVSLFILNSLQIFPLGYSPNFAGGGSYGNKLIHLVIKGFTKNGQLDYGVIAGTVITILGFFAGISYLGKFVSPVGWTMTVFTGVFWTSFLLGWQPITSILKSLGWELLNVPFFFIIAILFILGAMELAGGNVYE